MDPDAGNIYLLPFIRPWSPALSSDTFKTECKCLSFGSDNHLLMFAVESLWKESVRIVRPKGRAAGLEEKLQKSHFQVWLHSFYCSSVLTDHWILTMQIYLVILIISCGVFLVLHWCSAACFEKNVIAIIVNYCNLQVWFDYISLLAY